MRRIDNYHLGVLTSGMSDESCAGLLARSPQWVRERRAQLLGQREEPARDLEPEEADLSDLEVERPEAVRFARQFRRAGWGLREIAWLFDIEVEDLARAVL